MKFTYKAIVLSLLILLLINCKTISHLYSGIEKIKINISDNIFSFIYPIIRNSNNDTIIIVIGGSGYSSVLGSKVGGFSTGYSTAGILNLNLSKEYDLLILEKPNVEPFENGVEKRSLLSLYTVDDLSTIYAYSIDYFISIREYENIILFGQSEGGRLVPAIYNKILQQEKIDKLVIGGASGISQEEYLKILINQKIINDITLEEFNEKCSEIYKNPESFDLFWGHPYKRWASFLKYEYINELQNIYIPLLIIHGNDDHSVPVESARIVFNEYNSNGNISYFEVDGGHGAIFNNLEILKEWLQYD